MEFGKVGMMTFPAEWTNNPNVPNHQPAMVYGRYIYTIPMVCKPTNITGGAPACSC